MLRKSISWSVWFIWAPFRIFNSPSFCHFEPFGVPYVCFHPRSVLFLPQSILVQHKPNLASMSPAFAPRQHLRFIWGQLLQGSQTHSNWNSVVIVRHSSSPQVSGQNLVFKFARGLISQNVCEMFQLVTPWIHKLVNVYELGNFLVFRGETRKEWVTFWGNSVGISFVWTNSSSSFWGFVFWRAILIFSWRTHFVILFLNFNY